jgi:hypothetical protein
MKCDKGEIVRKAYTRKAYTRKDGTKVKATRVAAKCIKDRGTPGKGPYTLPPLKDNHFLTKHGYSLSKSFEDRKKALKKAIKENGSLSVLRHLVLVRNYSKSVKKNYDKYTKDIEFVQDLRKKQTASKKK